MLLTWDSAEAPTDTGAPADVIPRRAYRPYAVDAQKVNGSWMVLRVYDPTVDDYSLYREGRLTTTVSLPGVHFDEFHPTAGTSMNYVTWDPDRGYIVFNRYLPEPDASIHNVPEFEVWHYDRTASRLERFDTNLNRYFVRRGN